MLGNVSTMANLAFCCQMSKMCCSVKEDCAHEELLGIYVVLLCYDSGTIILYSK